MTSVFVYGTLAPGECRYPVLAPYISDDPTPDEVEGRLYNTGYGFPAAVIESGADVIPGFTMPLDEETVEQVRQTLDRIEGHPYLFERITVTTAAGVEAWVYRWVNMREVEGFTRIDSWIRDEHRIIS